MKPSSTLTRAFDNNSNLIQKAVNEIDPERQESRTIRKTTFDEIRRGLQLGAAYAFDKASYKKFYPLAKQAELRVMAADFEKHEAAGERFLIIQLTKSFPLGYVLTTAWRRPQGSRFYVDSLRAWVCWKSVGVHRLAAHAKALYC